MLLKNAMIYPMTGESAFHGWIRVEDGKVQEVGHGQSPDDENIFDCQGQNLYPGFIDAHAHVGMLEDSLNFEGNDCNECTDPITPHLRAMDGVNPLDRCFQEAFRAGVTTVMTSPGSANPIAGSMLAMKTFGRRTDDMLLREVGMKFALGENPKTVYNDKNVTPTTRMATAAAIREALMKAKKYLLNKMDAENDPDKGTPDFDMKSEALIPVLRRQQKAHFHCHRADDIFTAVRLAKEFELDLVLVHCTEGHLIADLLESEGVSAITGPLLSDRSKPELRHQEIFNPARLVENHIQTAICTDHPVIPIQYLPLSAALAVRGGLSREKAMEAITISAAKILGLENRIGSIEKGKDADFVLFKGDPLDVLQQPRMVMCNGVMRVFED